MPTTAVINNCFLRLFYCGLLVGKKQEKNVLTIVIVLPTLLGHATCRRYSIDAE